MVVVRLESALGVLFRAYREPDDPRRALPELVELAVECYRRGWPMELGAPRHDPHRLLTIGPLAAEERREFEAAWGRLVRGPVLESR